MAGPSVEEGRVMAGPSVGEGSQTAAGSGGAVAGPSVGEGSLTAAGSGEAVAGPSAIDVAELYTEEGHERARRWALSSDNSFDLDG